MWPRPKHHSSSQDEANLVRWAERLANSLLFLSSSTASVTFKASLPKSNSPCRSSWAASTVVLLKVFRLPPFFTTVKPSKSIFHKISSNVTHQSLTSSGKCWFTLFADPHSFKGAGINPQILSNSHFYGRQHHKCVIFIALFQHSLDLSLIRGFSWIPSIITWFEWTFTVLVQLHLSMS